MAAGALDDRPGRVASHVLGALIMAWAVALPIAPVAGSAGGGAAAAAAAVYAAGSLVCHQRAARSFTTSGRPWPVCARCAGVYLAAAVVTLAGISRRITRLAAAAEAAVWRRRFMFALVPMGLTWALERAALVTVSNGVRAFSGACLGVVIAAALLSVRQTRRFTERPEVN